MALGLAAIAVLLFVWGGYPLLMRLAAAGRRKRPAPLEGGWPGVSVIVATRDGADAVTDRVANLREVGPRDAAFQVVVAVDGDSEQAVERVSQVLGDSARVVPADPAGGKAAALNAGVRAATGTVLVFTDTHQRFDRDTIPQLLGALGAGRYDAVSGQLELPEGTRRSWVERYWRMERRLRADEAAVHSAIGVSGSVWAMRADLWQPLPEGLILDDLYTPMRLALAGHRVGYCAEAKAFDQRRTNATGEYARKVRTLTGNFQLLAWMPQLLVPIRNPVWLQFVCHKLLRLLTPWLVLLAAIGFGGWMLQSAGSRLLLWGVVAIVAVALLAAALGQWPRLRAGARWFVLMQAAIVMATVNGLTGRWDVWNRRSSS
ncbi:MAG TPA: glycosyltransferase [Gemmatimonadales bacterium]|nr:glycosyltransferase [Gemmatimonadales bacterium]